MTSTSHHAKTEKILTSLDAAKAQREKNHHLRNSLLDAEDLLQQLHEQLFTRRVHQEVDSCQRNADLAMDSFEKGLSMSDTMKKHNPARYMDDCSLKVTLAELSTEEATASQRAILYGIRELKSLEESFPEASLQGFFARTLDILDRAGGIVEEARIESDPWLPIMEPVLALLKRLLGTQPISTKTGPLLEQMGRLLEVDGELKSQQEVSADDGQVEVNEDLIGKRLTVLEGVNDLVSKEFLILEDVEASTIKHLAEEVETAKNTAKTALNELRVNASNRRQLLETDLANLLKENRRAQSDERLARSSFESEVERSNSSLEKNSAAQAEIWKKIEELDDQLVALARDRREEVDRRVKMMEQEERRRVDMQFFTSFVEEHERLLMSTIGNCQAQDKLGDAMEEVIAGSCGAVVKRLNSLSKEVDSLRSDAMNNHLDQFTKLYMILGELMYKVERRQDEMERKSDLAKAQQEAAMESMNPRAREFAIKKAELDGAIRKSNEYLHHLQQKADLYVEAFKPTERLLQSVNKTYTHPVKALEDTNASRRRKLMEFHALTLQAGGPGGVSAAEIDAERKEVEDQLAKLRPKPRRIQQADAM